MILKQKTKKKYITNCFLFFLIILAFKNTIKPKKWFKPVYELDKENKDNNGYKNEDLIVWMRTAALNTFRKLHRIVDTSKEPFK